MSVRLLLSAAALAVCIATRAHAQSAEDVERLQAIAEDPATPGIDRVRAADRAFEMRRGLISAAGPSEPRLPTWLIDQAAHLLGALSRDGSDAAVLYGLPSQAQALAVTRDAAEAERLLARADECAAALVRAGGDAETLGVEREVRMPFFRGRALVLLAASATDAPERRARAAEAAALLEPLAIDDPGAEAARAVNLAGARLLRADSGDARSAMDLYWGVTGLPPGTAPAPTLAEGWLGWTLAGFAAGERDRVLAAIRPARGRAPFVDPGPPARPDPLLTVLGADALSRALADEAGRTGERRWLGDAVREQEWVLSRRDLGVDEAGLRSLVYDRLEHVLRRAGASGTLEDLPAVAPMARAVSLSRQPGRADEALTLLRSVAARRDAGPLAADALWEASVMLTREPRKAGEPGARYVEAAGMLTRLAREFPADPRAGEAVAAAVAYSGSAGAEGGAANLDALRLATAGHATRPEIDAWRLSLARALIGAVRAGSLPGGTALDGTERAVALGALEAVSPGGAGSSDARALYERTSVEWLDADRERLEDARRVGDTVAVRRIAADEIVPLARRSAEWAQRNGSPLRDRFRLDLADGLTDAGDPAGGAIYRELRGVPGGAARVQLGLGRSLQLSGDDAAAFASWRDVVVTEGARERGPREFWHAWTLMLEMLARQNKDGARTATIRAQAAQLSLEDPALGGEPWAGRIGAVLAGLTR